MGPDDHMTPKLDLEAWRRHRSLPLRSSRFSSTSIIWASDHNRKVHKQNCKFHLFELQNIKPTICSSFWRLCATLKPRPPLATPLYFGGNRTSPLEIFRPDIFLPDRSTDNFPSLFTRCKIFPPAPPQSADLQYRVDQKKRPKCYALEKTHVVSLGRIALASGQKTVCAILTCHANDITQEVTEKYWMKKAHS